MQNQPDANSTISPLSPTRLWRALKFESLSVIALLFGLFFTSGYVYLETFNSTLGVPVSRLGFDSYRYAVYGGVNILIVLTALLIAMASVAVFSTIVHFFENPERPPHSASLDPTSRRYRLAKWLEKRFKRSREAIIASFLISLLALGFWGVWKLAVSQSVERAEAAAYKELLRCTSSTVLLNNMDVITGCVVGESDDVLYLVNKRSEGKDGILFEKRRVPKANISRVTSIKTLKRPG